VFVASLFVADLFVASLIAIVRVSGRIVNRGDMHDICERASMQCGDDRPASVGRN
jgi:hypothetical protein